MSPDSAISGHLDKWEESAVDYVDGRLSESARSAVEAHLDACPECAARMAAHRAASALFADTALADPPAGLEAQVLEQVFQVTAAASAGSIFARRRAAQGRTKRPRALPAGPWIPALAGAAAVVALVLALTISNSPSQLNESRSTLAGAFSEGTTVQAAADGAVAQSSTTTREQMAVNVTAGTDVPGSTGTTSNTASFASLQPVGPFVQDEEVMAGELAQASAPAYVFFDTPDDSAVTAQQADTLATELTSQTGLRLVDQEASSGVRAFAAFVPREDCSAVVDLLFLMGDSMKLSVCMSLQPGDQVTDWADTVLQDKYSVAELSASRVTPTGWRYTTSTAPPTTQGTAVTTKSAPLEDSEAHVLVVIFVTVQR